MPQSGDIAPDFTLKNSSGEKVILSDYTGKQCIVLLFFPLAFSEVCREEMCQIRDNMKLYESLNAKIFGISVDSFFTLKEFKKAQNLNFELLSDFNRDVSRSYDVLYKDYYGMKGVSKRAVFVIGPDSHIKHREVMEDSGKLPDFGALYEALS